MIQEVSLISQDECRTVRDKIHALRRYWIQRHVFLPYYTLGATSYLDTTEQGAEDGYYAGAKRMNPLLLEHFGWLYDRLAQTLSQVLDGPAFQHPGFAFPGFHLFFSEKLFEDPGMAAIHFDQQYTRLVWEKPEEIDFDNPVSFTLAIRMPSHGGGMYVWDLWLKDTEGLTDEELDEKRATTAMKYHQYTEGSLFVHSGHFLHQIAPFIDVQPEDERITLQGHAIRHRDGWHYYW